MAEFITRHKDVSFKDVHPTQTAGKKFEGKDLPPYAGLDGLESKYKSCKQCGFIFDTTKHGEGDGWGGNESATSTSQTHPITGSTLYYADPTIGAGCPFCGASNY